MIYIYACLLLHSAGKEITEESLRKVISAAGINPDEAKIKSLVSSVKRINLDDILKSAMTMPMPVAAPQPAPEEAKPVKEEEKKEEEKKEEEAFEGLSSLFG